ncbi:hypothetical protein E2542_SST22576 [Spatholobus suberectus]|nr:hypothetical protein E2542_SST22576 [Spatholobus suberectus]
MDMENKRNYCQLHEHEAALAKQQFGFLHNKPNNQHETPKHAPDPTQVPQDFSVLFVLFFLVSPVLLLNEYSVADPFVCLFFSIIFPLAEILCIGCRETHFK